MTIYQKYVLGSVIAVFILIAFVFSAFACYVPPIEVCLDENATNYQGSLPCTYPQEEIKCDEGQVLVDNQCVTPKEEPQGDRHVPTFAGSSTNPPAVKVCTGINPDQPIGRPELYKKTGPTSAHFGYYGGQADHYEVEYKYSKTGFVYGIPGGLPGTSTEFDLNNLKPGFSVLLARVHAFRGGCELVSEWFN